LKRIRAVHPVRRRHIGCPTGVRCPTFRTRPEWTAYHAGFHFVGARRSAFPSQITRAFDGMMCLRACGRRIFEISTTIVTRECRRRPPRHLQSMGGGLGRRRRLARRRTWRPRRPRPSVCFAHISDDRPHTTSQVFFQNGENFSTCISQGQFNVKLLKHRLLVYYTHRPTSQPEPCRVQGEYLHAYIMDLPASQSAFFISILIIPNRFPYFNIILPCSKHTQSIIHVYLCIINIRASSYWHKGLHGYKFDQTDRQTDRQ